MGVAMTEHKFALEAIKLALRSIDIETAKSKDDLILVSVLQEVIDAYDAGDIKSLVEHDA